MKVDYKVGPKKVAIVITTIRVPTLLLGYVENARKFGHTDPDDLDFIIVGDCKTPDLKAFLKAFGIGYPCYPCTYLDITDQKRYLDERSPKLRDHLPLNSVSRRNVGMLMAYDRGADIIITIDDDNFVTEDDFVGMHSHVGANSDSAIHTSSNWFNVCRNLRDQYNTPFYHRGFPRSQRWIENGYISLTETHKVMVNAGLWLGDPDIDAIARLNRLLNVTDYYGDNHFTLAPGTWSPFNSQNTAIAREVIPAYFLSPFVGRADDIWASYIVQRIAQHLGDVISFGRPLVRQDRSLHGGADSCDLHKNDLKAEEILESMTEEFCGVLRGLTLKGTAYGACFGEVIDGLHSSWHNESWTMVERSAHDEYLRGMQIWHGLFA